MQTNDKAINLIKQAEGFSSVPYICPAGVLTVGYGHTGSVDGKITQADAELLLKADLRYAEKAVERHVTVPLTDNQFSALVSFVYNVGEGNFAQSTLKKLVNRKEFDLAANEFNKWVHGGGKILPGLVARREAEKQLFLS